LPEISIIFCPSVLMSGIEDRGLMWLLFVTQFPILDLHLS